MIFDLLEPWGLLPVALPLLMVAALRLADQLLPDGAPLDRLAGAGVVGMAVVHALVGALATVGILSSTTFFVSLVAVFTAALLLGRRHARWPGWREVGRHVAPLTLMVVTTGLAAVAARLLPVWQWDSIGYHLPFVNFVLQARGFAGVPPDLQYISTYPHDIELGMIALRLLLPDDRLVDLAQLPYGLVGAVATAALTQHLQRADGLARPSGSFALFAGALWLTVPCVFLQLPTNYVDVGTAAALLCATLFLVMMPIRWQTLLLGGLALGVFLGSKPSAPGAAGLVTLLVAWRCWRAREVPGFVLFAAVTAVFGAEMYLSNFMRHGNPVWPVEVRLGPWTLPGPRSVEELLSAGAALPSASGSLLERLTVSWLSVTAAPVFDMKLGGLGLPFLVALPLAVVALVRRRSLALVVVLVATLSSPEPSFARYVLGFAAVVLALAFAELARLSAPRRLVGLAATTLAVVQLWWAFPGLTGDGPSLWSYWSLTDDQRRAAVGPHGAPTDYPRVWAAIERGEAAAFDESFEFPALLWAPTLAYPVRSVPPVTTSAELSGWLSTERVRVVALGPPRRALLDRTEWRPLFDCRSADCTVFIREDRALSSRLGTTGP